MLSNVTAQQVAGQVVMLEEGEERIGHEDEKYFTHCVGNMTHVQRTIYRVYKQ